MRSGLCVFLLSSVYTRWNYHHLHFLDMWYWSFHSVWVWHQFDLFLMLRYYISLISLRWFLCWSGCLEEHHIFSFLNCCVKLFNQVASFPFDDHNCPPIQLIISFCQSAYSWLKEDIENVVVVHCKAGMARTGLMISSLLLYLKVPPFLFDFILEWRWVWWSI